MAEVSAIESTLSSMQSNMSEMLGKALIVFVYLSYFGCLVGDRKIANCWSFEFVTIE